MYYRFVAKSFVNQVFIDPHIKIHDNISFHEINIKHDMQAKSLWNWKKNVTLLTDQQIVVVFDFNLGI